jgi:exopolysaccharide biosynthesis polyprenyl glycosylphosphotransferase
VFGDAIFRYDDAGARLMFSRHNRLISRLYLLADALLALASFTAAHWLRSDVFTPRPLYPLAYYFWIVPLCVVLWPAVGWATGIYRDIQEDNLRRPFTDPLKVSSISTTLLFALTYAFKWVYISRLLLGFYAVANLVAMILFRWVARRLGDPLRRAFGGYRQFLLVGGAPEAAEIARILEANEPRGVRLFGMARVGPSPENEFHDPRLRRSYPVYPLNSLDGLIRRHVIDEVIFAVGKEDLDKLENAFLLCEQEGVKTRVMLSFFPHVVSHVYLERLRDMPLLTFTTTPASEYLLLLKRAFDFTMAFLLLLLLSPLFLILAVLVKVTSRGPVLYRQSRCGLGGRKFTVYKFRSMRPDADLRREELEALNEMDGPVFKISNDPRCTPLGRFMRKFSLDELPQLVNVLKGDMSFVGPRPPLPEEVEKYESWQRRRLRMTPGLTCLWALEGRNRLSFRRWMELDLEYIDRWSPLLDLKIILKTIPVVLLGRGAS